MDHGIAPGWGDRCSTPRSAEASTYRDGSSRTRNFALPSEPALVAWPGIVGGMGANSSTAIRRYEPRP